MRLFAYAMLFVLVLPAVAPAQISPGELADAHADLEGMKNCLKCHELGAGPSTEKCLACHAEIASRIDAREGYHHRVITVGNQACFECHSDHAGRSFDLIHWPEGRDRFDHTQAGWKLGGAHASVKCRDCHRESFMAASFRDAHPTADPSRTYLGLDEACLGCHSDVHAKQFDRDCASCHGDSAWKPADRFDHGTSVFPLRGGHARADCAKCHVTVAEVVQYKGVAHESCTACHKDAHSGRLGTDCASCHGDDAWKPATNFDHARTRYPLTGRHRDVACEKCHASPEASQAAALQYAGPAYDNCAPCHKDPHEERLGQDCKSCHDTRGWNVAAVAQGDGFDHARTRYPLAGRHVTVPCEKCHRDGAKTADLAFDTCDKCHADTHEGQFLGRTAGAACEGCHDVDGFVPAKFTIADHAETRFAITGAHLAQPCITCHALEEFPSGNQCRRFRLDDTGCRTCHADVHAAQFDRRPPKSCEECHTSETWRLPDFDHDRKTTYRLEGQHRGVACDRCHVDVEERGQRFAQYRSTPTLCQDCHTGTPMQLGGR